MRPLAYVAFAAVLAALQAVLLRWADGGRIPLQLLVPCVAWLGLNAGNVDGVVAAAGIGYVIDVLDGAPRGLFTFLAVVLFLASRAAGMAVDLRGRAGFALLSGVGCLAVSFGAILLERSAGAPEAAPGGHLAGRVLAEAALTALLAPLVRLGMNRLEGLFQKEESGLAP